MDLDLVIGMLLSCRWGVRSGCEQERTRRGRYVLKRLPSGVCARAMAVHGWCLPGRGRRDRKDATQEFVGVQCFGQRGLGAACGCWRLRVERRRRLPTNPVLLRNEAPMVEDGKGANWTRRGPGPGVGPVGAAATLRGVSGAGAAPIEEKAMVSSASPVDVGGGAPPAK